MNSTATFNPVGGIVPQNSPPFASDTIAINAGDRIFRTGMRDMNNVAPRAGFAYRVTGKTTSSCEAVPGSSSRRRCPTCPTGSSRSISNGYWQHLSQRRPARVHRGPACGASRREDILAGRVPTPPQQPRVIAHDYQLPYSWQSVIGFQKQFATVWALESDLVQLGGIQRRPRPGHQPLLQSRHGIQPDLTRFGRPDSRTTGSSSGRTARGGRTTSPCQRSDPALPRQLPVQRTHTLMFLKHDNYLGTLQLHHVRRQTVRHRRPTGRVDRLPAEHASGERPLSPPLGFERIGRLLLRVGLLHEHT